MSSSRAPAATATAAALRGSEAAAAEMAAGTDHLWAKAAELERDFAGYKRRLAERRAQAAAELAGGSTKGEDEERGGGGGGDDAAAGRGRRHEEYVKRRDERLRNEWRARMERKEAEVQALWARLDRTGSRGRAGVGYGELAAASRAAREDQDRGNMRLKPGNGLEVKVKSTAPATPRCSVPSSPATKLSRPRTSMPPSPAAASARLSTPDPRRRPPHLHREHPPKEPPATPRKENRLPPLSTAVAALPATPRPRTTMLSRSRSMFKDRGFSSTAIGESPRPPRVQNQQPRPSYDSACSNVGREPALAPSRLGDAATAVTRSKSCSNGKSLLVGLKNASAVAPEPFRLMRSVNGAVSPPHQVIPIPREESDSSEIAPASSGNAAKKNSHERADQCSDKAGSVEITGDSDTEPSYVYIKKDRDEQALRPCQAPASLGKSPGPEQRSETDIKDSVNVDDAVESTGSNDVSVETQVTDAEETSRRESSESLYSNVQSSLSPRSALDTSAVGQSPESEASPRARKKPEMEDAQKSLPIPTTPRSSAIVQSPMDAVSGLKRLLTFGKKSSKGSEAAAAAIVGRTPRSVAPAPPAADGCMSAEWPIGDCGKARLDCSDVASADDLDDSYVISPQEHVSVVPSYPANPEPKEPVLHAGSPRVHRSFFSFSSFKSRAV